MFLILAKLHLCSIILAEVRVGALLSPLNVPPHSQTGPKMIMKKRVKLTCRSESKNFP